MSFARTPFEAIRAARISAAGTRAQFLHPSVRRRLHSDQTGTASKTKINLPWILGAAVSIPTCFYFLESKLPAQQDKAAASKTPGDSTTQSGKQEKLSNADTKHSRDIGKDSPLSQKGEDIPESAKSKGTVDYRKT